jgi:CubicO group peptidase (beta-lactamase class C family)
MRRTFLSLIVAFLTLAGLATGCGQSSAPKQDAPTPNPAALTPDQSAALDRIGELSVAGRVTPSVIIAVARNGQMAYAKGFGYRNVESGAQTTAETRYPIGSNTKQFTAGKRPAPAGRRQAQH